MFSPTTAAGAHEQKKKKKKRKTSLQNRLETDSHILLRRGFIFGIVWIRIFTGTLIFKENDAPRYVLGFIVVVVTSFVAGVYPAVSLCLSIGL
ncbi:hypothetical protein N7449_006384 [Penicillium cf. viridicatum]|uniref:Uncharacterized protein n=1 Tax=Penicillium cf. viridicatum TaxID=2972119 RepID=A0A9W9JFF2_9EURO|nr:hypothetical protein N7449_006384 [Penicillium cf. viridicatum]